ncbi:MAG: hypothetical protein OQL08_06330 [Gammaproteobacteria bacterium]|nr:hypothetical protein [Gammaproteobacteria bacterium]
MLLVLAAALASCCQTPQRSVAEPAPEPAIPAATMAPPIVPPSPSPAAEQQVAEPVAVEVSAGEGDVVCHKGDDVRIIGIHMLNNGRCMLVYNNTLTGSGTENTLADKAACEQQRGRMVENFMRSGFVCE